MKVLLIIVSVLVVATTVYGFDADRLKMFYENMKECGGETPTADALICTLKKENKVLNANGEFMRDAAIQGIADATSEASRTEKAQEIYNKCHDEAEQRGLTGNEQAKHISTCALSVLAYFDKL